MARLNTCICTTMWVIFLQASIFIIVMLLLASFPANVSDDFEQVLIKEMSQTNSVLAEKAELPQNETCRSGTPCLYPEVVDFRIIIITFNRAVSLLKLLKTVNTVLLDGDTGRVEIWLDRDKHGNIDNNTLEIAQRFHWVHGPARVHVQERHVGIYGQWIDTWSPGDYSSQSKELALILEDDLSVSPFIYRWIRAVHRHYGKTSDFVGCSLTSDEVTSHDGLYSKLAVPHKDVVFMYKCIGTWGFAPSPQRWHDFQQWFHATHGRADFHPYVPGIAPTQWYKDFEESGRADSMWEMWLIFYTYKEKLFTVYNNLPAFNGNSQSCLSINRREVGLHVGAKGREDMCSLLVDWIDEYIAFPLSVWKLDWTGRKIDTY